MNRRTANNYWQMSTESILLQMVQSLNELKQETQLMNNKITGLEQSIKSLTEEMRRGQKEGGKSFFEGYLDVLKKWTGLEHFQTVFDSSKDGMDRSKIYNGINSKERVMIIIRDNHNNIFGCYQRTKVVLEINENDSYGAYTKAKPEDFFVFSLNNNHGVEPRIARKKSTGYAIKMYPLSNANWILGAHCCFYIGSTDNSFISPKIKQQFNVPSDFELTSFNDTVYPQTFSMADLVIFHWD